MPSPSAGDQRKTTNAAGGLQNIMQFHKTEKVLIWSILINTQIEVYKNG
jgi:hypothetical protein